MIQVRSDGRSVVVTDDRSVLAPRHESQLAVWGFSDGYMDGERVLQASDVDCAETVARVSRYFEKQGIRAVLDNTSTQLLDEVDRYKTELEIAKKEGGDVKAGDISHALAREFRQFREAVLTRNLKSHQVKAALHMIATRHGANFSVPGSGKTSVVIAVFEWLKAKGVVDYLFVVGPPACFQPWKDEYFATTGRGAQVVTLAGGSVESRQEIYLVPGARDMVLTTYQTLHRDYEQVGEMLRRERRKSMLVFDEAHYIKQPDGAWATAALSVAKYANVRCILTGTPFPNSLTDAFNLFDVLWPRTTAIDSRTRGLITAAAKGGAREEAASSALQAAIGPLFYRVRKRDLGLAPQQFMPPVVVQMNPHERRVYDAIVDKIRALSMDDYRRDYETLTILWRGRMMRLRQCLSYTKMIGTALSDYEENFCGEETSLSNIIKGYDQLERPAKIDVLISLVERLRSRGEKVVIWSNFISSLHLIEAVLQQRGIVVRMLYGATPFERDSYDEHVMTREQIVRDFGTPEGPVEVLVANPAACAESISLHKACHNAVYYDMSYNCAQFLQSLDRIHRVGGSENTEATYYFLQYADTLDQDIHEAVRNKAERMEEIIDAEYPVYSLDMFSEDDEIAAYERLFNRSDIRRRQP